MYSDSLPALPTPLSNNCNYLLTLQKLFDSRHNILNKAGCVHREILKLIHHKQWIYSVSLWEGRKASYNATSGEKKTSISIILNPFLCNDQKLLSFTHVLPKAISKTGTSSDREKQRFQQSLISTLCCLVTARMSKYYSQDPQHRDMPNWGSM